MKRTVIASNCPPASFYDAREALRYIYQNRARALTCAPGNFETLWSRKK